MLVNVGGTAGLLIILSSLLWAGVFLFITMYFEEEMRMSYSHQTVEQKWQAFWEQNHTFRTTTDSNKPFYYALDMFPFPSGAGLHVGHPEGYTATDILARMRRMQGYNVLHPMAGMRLDCLLSNTRSIQGTIRLNLRSKILKPFADKSSH